MEDMQRFINDERNKRIDENTQKIIDKFKKEVENEGGKISCEVRYGDTYPKLYISDGISDALKEKINAFASQFYKRDDFLGQ